jgi:hypothetical protein
MLALSAKQLALLGDLVDCGDDVAELRRVIGPPVKDVLGERGGGLWVGRIGAPGWRCPLRQAAPDLSPAGLRTWPVVVRPCAGSALATPLGDSVRRSVLHLRR